MNKRVSTSTQLGFTEDFPGLKGVNILASQYPIEPFLVFTEYLMTQPVFGPHPHAGVSVITYMLPDSKGSFINRDSQGDFSSIEPGGLHITQAGSGMHHDEFPKVTGVEAHGFQIWINHSSENRWVTPKGMHSLSNQIPEIVTDDYRVRIIHGVFNNTLSYNKMVTDVNLFHVFLKPNKSITMDAKEMAFSYGLTGKGITENKNINPQLLITYEASGNSVSLQASKEGQEFMFGTAIPLQEPITYGGPFVMTSAEQMAETRKRYARGEMGRLEKYTSEQTIKK